MKRMEMMREISKYYLYTRPEQDMVNLVKRAVYLDKLFYLKKIELEEIMFNIGLLKI